MKRRGYNGSREGGTDRTQVALAIGYLYAHVESQLVAISAETGGAYTPSQLADWLADLLPRAETLGVDVDHTEHLSALRRKTTKGHEKRVTKTSIHVRSRGNKPQRVISIAGRRRIALAQKKRWAKVRALKKAA